MSASRRSLMIHFLGALPRNGLSRAVGRLAETRLPGPLQRAVNRMFGRAVGIDFSEVRDPPESFDSLQAFFTRALRDGARPVDPSADAFVSPCDGSWGASGTVTDGTLLQLKGRPYSLGALLGNDAAAEPFEGGAFATLYLAPRDYHRFHAPCAAAVERLAYLPGTLWPVNRAGVESIDGLFAENERICAHLRVDRGLLVIVAVGATNVGKVRVTFDDLETNVDGASAAVRVYAEPIPLAKGEEWGRFEFGSTLVIVAAPGTARLDAESEGTRVRVGRRIGTLG